MEAPSTASLTETKELLKCSSTRKMQKHLGRLGTLAEENPGNNCFYCLLSCLLWDKIGMYKVRSVQRTIDHFSYEICSFSSLYKAQPASSLGRQKPPCEQGVSKSDLLTRLNRRLKREEMLMHLCLTGTYRPVSKSRKYI